MIRYLLILFLFLMILELEADLQEARRPEPERSTMSKGARIRDNRTEAKPKTKQLQAKNVPLGSTVILRGGLGTIEVAEKTKTKGGSLRLSEAPVLRPGNRRKRRLQRRCVIVAPATPMEVVK